MLRGQRFCQTRSRGHVPVGRLSLIEGEYLVDYRLNAARRYRTAHRLCIEPTVMPARWMTSANCDCEQ